MSTRKIMLSVFVGAIVSLFISQAVLAQTEKPGAVEYTPPKGWAKSAQEHAVVFHEINREAGVVAVNGRLLVIKDSNLRKFVIRGASNWRT